MICGYLYGRTIYKDSKLISRITRVGKSGLEPNPGFVHSALAPVTDSKISFRFGHLLAVSDFLKRANAFTHEVFG